MKHTFEVGQRVKAIGQDIQGTVKGIGNKITVSPKGGSYDGKTLMFSPMCLIHVFDRREKTLILGKDIALEEGLVLNRRKIKP